MDRAIWHKFESHVARFEPDHTAEQLFAQLSKVEKVHKKFNLYLRRSKINIDLPKKSEIILERRKLFIEWYVEQNQDRPTHILVDELTYLVFASRTTIYNILSGNQ